MIKNSPSRIAKRRKGALARRQVNIATYQKYQNSFDSDALSDNNKLLLAKIKQAETEIENLNKKGVR